jgi:HK97 family phage portal protein
MGLRDLWKALRRQGQKGNFDAGFVSFDPLGRASWSPRRFDAFAREGYQKNVVVFRSVALVARAAASVPWRLKRKGPVASGPNVGHVVEEHALLNLIRRPNPRMGGAEFFEEVLGFFLLSGNAFIESVAPSAKASPLELWPLRPDRMKVVPGSKGLPKAYLFCAGSEERQWRVDPISGLSAVLHLKSFHPLDDWWGMSPLEAAAFATDQRNAADEWNMSLLQNAARPSGALIFAPKGETSLNLSDEQFARLKEEIREQYAGARNSGRPMLLDGGMSWKEMGLSPKDMDFLNSRHAASRDIALAFGVPPQLLGIPGDNTYANYQEARLALWEETVIPLVRHLRDELNGWLVPRFDENLELDADLDEIPALTLRREKTWARIGNAHFLTVNEKHAAIGFPPLPGGDLIQAAQPARKSAGRGSPNGKSSRQKPDQEAQSR